MFNSPYLVLCILVKFLLYCLSSPFLLKLLFSHSSHIIVGRNNSCCCCFTCKLLFVTSSAFLGAIKFSSKTPWANNWYMVTILVCQTRLSMYYISICILGNHLKLCSHHLDPFNRSTGQPFFLFPCKPLKPLAQRWRKNIWWSQKPPETSNPWDFHGKTNVKTPWFVLDCFFWWQFTGHPHLLLKTICFPVFRFWQKSNGLVSSFKPLLTIIKPIIYHRVSHMNPIRLSFMVVFMYWSLEVPIWSLWPGRGAGQLGFVEETPWMGVLTQNWSHHFFLQYEMFRIYLGWFKRLPFWDESSQVAPTKKRHTGVLVTKLPTPKIKYEQGKCSHSRVTQFFGSCSSSFME